MSTILTNYVAGPSDFARHKEHCRIRSRSVITVVSVLRSKHVLDDACLHGHHGRRRLCGCSSGFGPVCGLLRRRARRPHIRVGAAVPSRECPRASNRPDSGALRPRPSRDLHGGYRRRHADSPNVECRDYDDRRSRDCDDAGPPRCPGVRKSPARSSFTPPVRLAPRLDLTIAADY